jgi:hypothetical protein
MGMTVLHVSLYSEAAFKTLRCRPEFPDRFGSIEHARGSSQ